MTLSNMKIRRATEDDFDAVVRITKDNGHYWTPEVDGVEALGRQLAGSNNVFLVCELEEEVVGFALGSWDGARAFIHKLSVRPDIRGRGIGSELVASAIDELKGMGAHTVAVAAADGSRVKKEDSTGFWKKVGFEFIPARLMINFNIWGDDDEGE